MTIVPRFVGLAEGAAQDMGGRLTLVGFDAQILIADEYPANLAPRLVALFEDSAPPGEHVIAPGAKVAISARIEDEDGTTQFVFEAVDQPIGEGLWPAAPPRLQILLETPFVAAKAGKYHARVGITVTRDGRVLTEVSQTREFFVFPRSEQRRPS